MDRRITPIRAPTVHGSWSAALLVALLAIVPRAGAAPSTSNDATFTLRVGYQPYFAEAWSGALVRALRLYSGHLPPNVAVEFKVGTKGAEVLSSALRRGEIDLAYLGITPALTVTQDTRDGDFRILAVAAVSHRLCNIVLAPVESVPHDPEAALRWLDGKQLAAPGGTCAEAFLADVIERAHVRPTRVLEQSFDLLSTSLRAHKVDAVAVWEPIASDLMRSAGVVRLIDGEGAQQQSATFIVVNAALLRDHPDVLHGWLEAERAAQRVLAAANVQTLPADALAGQAVGFSRQTLIDAWAGPAHAGPWTSPATYPFVVTPEVSALLREAAGHLARRGKLSAATLRPTTVADDAARILMASTPARVNPASGGR